MRDIKILSGDDRQNEDFKRLVEPYIEGRKEPDIRYVSNVDATWFACEEGLAGMFESKGPLGVPVGRMGFIYVHPPFRKMKVATELTIKRIEWAKQHYTQLLAIVGSQPCSAIWSAFLVRRFGFTRRGRIVHLITANAILDDLEDRDVVGFN